MKPELKYRVASIKSMAEIIMGAAKTGNPMQKSFELLIEWIEELQKIVEEKDGS